MMLRGLLFFAPVLGGERTGPAEPCRFNAGWGNWHEGWCFCNRNVWSASEVQNDGSATTSDASQSRPYAELGSTFNGTASIVSFGSNGSGNDFHYKQMIWEIHVQDT